MVLVIGLTACNSSDQSKAREDAHEAGREVSDEAKKADREIKKDAKEVGRKVDAAVGPNSGSAYDRMSHVDADAKEAGARAGVKLSHAALLAKVKSKLAADAGLSTLSNVDVTLHGGVVTLSGTAANEEQKKAAEIAAAQVDGVTQVRNDLAVRQ